MADQHSKKTARGPLRDVGRDLFGRAPRRAYVPAVRSSSWRARVWAWIRHKKTGRVVAALSCLSVVGVCVAIYFGPANKLMNGDMTMTLVPPAYTGLSPIVLLSPSGADTAGGYVEIPEGTQLSAEIAPGTPRPQLDLNGQVLAFSTRDDGTTVAEAPIARGQTLNTATLSLTQGWRRLGTWRLRVMADNGPRIAFVETPAPMEQKTVRLSFEAEDDHGVDALALHVRPLPEGDEDAETAISTQPIGGMGLKRLRRVMYQDLTGLPGAGGRAEIWITATDGAGQTAATDKRVIVLPARQFSHPLARVLIEERARLLAHGDKQDVRQDVAGIMAGIARQQGRREMDLALMMLLRAGAVRLILKSDGAALDEVAAMLWQIASRIEDGPLGRAQDILRTAEGELSDALDRAEDQAEILARIDRIQNILGHYMDEVLAERAPSAAGTNSDFVLQSDKEFLTREDLHTMMEVLRGQAIMGAYDTARASLTRFQDVMEGLKPVAPSLSAAQKQLLQQASVIRAYARAQKRLWDQTLLLARGDKGAAPAGLKERVAEQQRQLSQKMGLQPWDDAQAAAFLKDAIEHMADAQQALVKGNYKKAHAIQAEILDLLQQASDSMTTTAGGTMVAHPGAEP